MNDDVNGKTRSLMLFNEYYLDCLSHASYLIGDTANRRAVVVDPQRDIGEYVADAEAAGVMIDAVIETHFHADFVSGHLELARATGARIVYSSVAETEFESVGGGRRGAPPARPGRGGSGGTRVPAHPRPYARVDEHRGVRACIRPRRRPRPVRGADRRHPLHRRRRPPRFARLDRIHPRRARRPALRQPPRQVDDAPRRTRVFPAHGAGSACGKNLSTELSSTIGIQRATNYALRAPDKPTFIELVTEGQPPAPGYFLYDAILNRQVRDLLDEETPPTPLTYDGVMNALDGGALLVDGRTPEEFATGHLQQSINVGLAGRYAEFAGSVLPSDADIVLFTEPGQELEGKNRLGRIGFDRVIGYVSDPYRDDDHPSRQRRDRFASHGSRVRSTSRQVDDIQLVDVRNPGEVAAGTIDGAIPIPVGQLRS